MQGDFLERIRKLQATSSKQTTEMSAHSIIRHLFPKGLFIRSPRLKTASNARKESNAWLRKNCHAVTGSGDESDNKGGSCRSYFPAAYLVRATRKPT